MSAAERVHAPGGRPYQLSYQDAQKNAAYPRGDDSRRGGTIVKTKALGAYSIRAGMVLLVFAALALWIGQSRPFAQEGENLDWPHHGNDLANTRFQNVDQINRNNVRNLQVAWVFHTGVLDDLAELQASPIVVDGRLFVTDGHDNLFALNAATGPRSMKFQSAAAEITRVLLLETARSSTGAWTTSWWPWTPRRAR